MNRRAPSRNDVLLIKIGFIVTKQSGGTIFNFKKILFPFFSLDCASRLDSVNVNVEFYVSNVYRLPVPVWNYAVCFSKMTDRIKNAVCGKVIFDRTCLSVNCKAGKAQVQNRTFFVIWQETVWQYSKDNLQSGIVCTMSMCFSLKNKKQTRM